MPNTLLTTPKLGDAFIYVSTIQRMTMNLFGDQRALAAINPNVDEAAHPD